MNAMAGKKNFIRLTVTLIVVLAMVCMLVPHCFADNDRGDAGQADQYVQYVVYEAVFLDNYDVDRVFHEIRGEQLPYEFVSSNYHVTTAFLPDKDARELYGKEIEVRILGYKAGEVMGDEGAPVYCEGLKVALSSDDTDMAAYLMGGTIISHLTGSYSDLPRYTQFLDFSDMKPMDIVLKGTFGAFLNGSDNCNGFITFDADQVDRIITLPAA